MFALQVMGRVFLFVLEIFGLVFIFRAFFDWLFAPPSITVAVKVISQEDIRNLDILLGEAERSVFRRRGVESLVLISQALCDDIRVKELMETPAFTETVRKFNARVYIYFEPLQPSSE